MEILDDGFESGPTPRAFGDLSHSRHVPEVTAGGCARFGRGDAGFDAQPLLFREVKPDFVGKVPVVLGPPPHAQLQPLPQALQAGGHELTRPFQR